MSNRNKIEFTGELSDVANNIDQEEWMFYELANNVADQIHDLMEFRGLSKADLARKLNTSKSYITQLLHGDTNLTLRTLVKIVIALEGSVETNIFNNSHEICWSVVNDTMPVKDNMFRNLFANQSSENLFTVYYNSSVLTGTNCADCYYEGERLNENATISA